MARRNTPKIPAGLKPRAAVLTAAAHRYVEAAVRFQATQQSLNIARVRFLEVSSHFDTMLELIVLQNGSQKKRLSSGTEAVQIKATARNLAEAISTKAAPDHKAQLHKQLSHLIYEAVNHQLQGSSKPDAQKISPINQAAA